VRVSKWGNSLALRLPTAVVDALGLQEGDNIEVVVADSRIFEIAKDDRRKKALERLRRLRRSLPEGFRFNREEANER
jgi:antitoxin MazE